MISKANSGTVSFIWFCGYLLVIFLDGRLEYGSWVPLGCHRVPDLSCIFLRLGLATTTSCAPLSSVPFDSTGPKSITEFSPMPLHLYVQDL